MPPTPSNGSTALCPTSIYDKKTEIPTPGLLDCSDVDTWGDAQDKWLCSKPCSFASPCLFNVEVDVHELHDVAAANPLVVAELSGRLAAWSTKFWLPEMPADNGRYCEQANTTGFVGPWH